MNILALFQCIQPILSKTDVRRVSRVVQAMLRMTGRITMLGLSRWAGKGSSYRSGCASQGDIQPDGSQNRDKTQVTLTPELKRIQKMV